MEETTEAQRHREGAEQYQTLVRDLAQIADSQSLQLAVGAEPTPAAERMAAVLAEHGVSASALGIRAALDRYDAALRVCAVFLPAVLPAAVQQAIDLAQAAYFTATGDEPLSLLQLAPEQQARNPFAMCKDG